MFRAIPEIKDSTPSSGWEFICEKEEVKAQMDWSTSLPKSYVVKIDDNSILQIEQDGSKRLINQKEMKEITLKEPLPKSPKRRDRERTHFAIFSEDRQMLVTSGYWANTDYQNHCQVGEVKVWDTRTGKLIKAKEFNPSDQIFPIHLLSGNRICVEPMHDIICLDLKTLETCFTLPRGGSREYAVQGDILVDIQSHLSPFSRDRSIDIFIYDVSTNKPQCLDKFAKKSDSVCGSVQLNSDYTMKITEEKYLNDEQKLYRTHAIKNLKLVEWHKKEIEKYITGLSENTHLVMNTRNLVVEYITGVKPAFFNKGNEKAPKKDLVPSETPRI